MKASRLQNAVTTQILRKGEKTLVNGQETKGLWAEAQPGRAQQFANDNGLVPPIYEVQFPAAVKIAPFALANGTAVVRKATGEHGAVVRVIPPVQGDSALGDTLLFISCLVELYSTPAGGNG